MYLPDTIRRHFLLLVLAILILRPAFGFTAVSVSKRRLRDHVSVCICASRQLAVRVQSLGTTAEGPTVEQAKGWKNIILEESKGTANGLEATPQQRENIAKVVNALVALNPTNDIVTSDLATGMWDLVYTSTSGVSGGKLGPFIGKVQQEVDIAKGLYINYVRLGPLVGELVATWEIVNKQQWKVLFQTISFLLWGNQVLKYDLRQEGLWTLSYLDQDMRILTARSMEKETGNLYILARA